MPARWVAVLFDEQPPPAVATFTVAAPNKLLAKAGSAVRMQGQVFAIDGNAPEGTVQVFDGGTVIAEVELVAGDRGRFEVKLPKLPRGLHVLRTEFVGGEGFADSQSFPVPILLW